MSDRRTVLVCAAFAGVSPLILAQASRPNEPLGGAASARVGILMNSAPRLGEAAIDAFKKWFAVQGYGASQGGIVFEQRNAGGDLQRLTALARELASRKPDAIIAVGASAATAAKAATTGIPIVFSIVVDPVAAGLVQSLDHPGGNLTGITSLDRGQPAAQMKLLKESVPRLKRVAILSDRELSGENAEGLASLERDNVAAARSLGLEGRVFKVEGHGQDLAGVFEAIGKAGSQAVVLLEAPGVVAERIAIVRMATSNRLPTLLPGGTADAGGLLTYGTLLSDTWSLVPGMVIRTFKGEKPSEIPVEFVAHKELVVNMRTARLLGVKVPDSVRRRADRIVE
jgi:putative ABC transport system substrate-binding protein